MIEFAKFSFVNGLSYRESKQAICLVIGDLLSAGWSTTLFHWQGVKLVGLSSSWAMDCAKGPNE